MIAEPEIETGSAADRRIAQRTLPVMISCSLALVRQLDPPAPAAGRNRAAVHGCSRVGVEIVGLLLQGIARVKMASIVSNVPFQRCLPYWAAAALTRSGRG